MAQQELGSDRVARVPATAPTEGTATTTSGMDLDTIRRYGVRDRPSKGFWATAISRILRDYLTVAAIVVFLLMCLMSLFATQINDHILQQNPSRQRLMEAYKPPLYVDRSGSTHWLGTDNYGRDYAARIVQGSEVSIRLGFMVAVMALTIGVVTGLITAFYQGWVDDLISFVVNLFSITPSFYILIFAATLVPPTIASLAILIALFGWMDVTRQVRGVALSIRERDYVHAARALGASDRRIMFRHVLPNVSSIVTVVAGFEVASGILAETGLSYLGLGIRPPLASWGNMLSNSQEYIIRAPLLAVWPGLFVFITILAIYLMADGLRDALDPRMKNAK